MYLVDRARQRYWGMSAQIRRIRALLNPELRSFRQEVVRSHAASLLGNLRPRPEDGGCALEDAIGWLLRAQAATPDDGVSLGYFPCDPQGGWRASYPETTGYIIPTLLDYARLRADASVRARALAAARWEMTIQMSSGAVQGGPVCPPDKQRAAVFNTGMVLQGWSAAWRESRETGILEAGRRAADFLVSDMDDQGHFRTHGGFVSEARIKTYNVLCAWALYRFAADSGDLSYAAAGLRNAVAALSRQLPNGWFRDNDLDDPDRPLTHTIGYTLQGLLEVGVCAGRDDLIEAARRGVAPLIERVSDNGFLAGRFDRNWRAIQRSSCLTGSAQVAIVLYRLFELDGTPRYREVADRLVNFLKALQAHDSEDPNVNGAIAGSFPLFGEYMTAGYPNWATKYFCDALMLQERLSAPAKATA